MTRLLILVEGQSEERFVKDTLAPYLGEHGVWVTSSLVWTKKIASGGGFRGGVSTWAKICNHLTNLSRDSDAWITMLFDFYAFPGDYQEAHQPGDPRQRVTALQDRISKEVNHLRFIPFLALHEFEAWLFCSPDKVAEHFGQTKLAAKVSQVVQKVGEPERINHGLTTHPKAQLERIYPDYKEVADGATLMGKIGIPAIRDACPHFAQWLGQLEKLGTIA